MKFTISIPRESCTNAKAKYSSSVVPPDPLGAPATDLFVKCHLKIHIDININIVSYTVC